MIYGLLLLLLGICGGVVASVTGFGIGSILTPALAARTGTKLAVAAVSIPHLLGTAVRFWTLRKHINRGVLWSFGMMSAAGGLAGALLHERATSPILTGVFGGLLVFGGFTGVTGLADRMRFGRRMAWFAGAVSGLFGGLVGNQGGIRSAAMLGFDIPKAEFVGTATAIALLVDAARMPVYLAKEAGQILAIGPWVLLAALGVLLGTFVGLTALRRVPESQFRRVVSAIIFCLGVYMLLRV